MKKFSLLNITFKFLVSLSVYILLLVPIFGDPSPAIFYLGEIKIDKELSPELETTLKNQIRVSIRKVQPKQVLVLDDDTEKSQVEHIQKFIKRKPCAGEACSDYVTENLDIDFRITGKFTEIDGKYRLALRVIKISENRVLRAKEAIFPNRDFDFTINELVHALLKPGYNPSSPETTSDLDFQFPEIKVERQNPDLRIFIENKNEKISVLLKNFEKRILQADNKYREEDFESAYNIYIYIRDRIESTLSPDEKEEISFYLESLSARIYLSVNRLLASEFIRLDRKVRADLRDSEKLLKHMKSYKDLFVIYKSTNQKNPELADAILGRITKLEYLIVRSFEESAVNLNYLGKFTEAEKKFDSLKEIISDNKNLKNMDSYLGRINKKIISNQNDRIQSHISETMTLYYIAERENFNRNLYLKKGELQAAESSFNQMKLCLSKAEGILVSQKKEIPEVRLYYTKIEELFKFKKDPQPAKLLPKRDSPYFVNYSSLWYSLYFPGLGQYMALPDEDKSRNLFYSGILAFTHLIYRGGVSYNASLEYNTTRRLDPFILSTLDENTRLLVSYQENVNFQNLRKKADTANENLKISAGIFSLIYLISLGDAIYTYSKGSSLSGMKNPFTVPVGVGVLGFQMNYVPLQNANREIGIRGEVRYDLEYSERF